VLVVLFAVRIRLERSARRRRGERLQRERFEQQLRKRLRQLRWFQRQQRRLGQLRWFQRQQLR
jgi:hypothetical protein